jgi:diguanylate cyclase (GGDEF)-like protein
MFWSYVRSRFLSIGLIFILAFEFVAGYVGIWIIHVQNDASRHEAHLNSLYQQARFWITVEDAQASIYLLHPNPETLAQYKTATIALDQTLHTLQRDEDGSEQSRLQALVATYEQYFTTLQHLFAAANAGNTSSIQQIDSEQADPAFHSLESTILSLADADIADVQKSQNVVKTQITTTLIAMPIIYSIGFLFLYLVLRYQHAIQHELETVRQQELDRLSQAALTDPLTGARNYRAYQEKVPQYIHIAAQQNTPLCFVMLDVDQFKDLNDTHGHDFGDLVLKTLGEHLQRIAYADCVYRLGGDEFAVVLPQCDLPQAQALMLTLQQSMQEVLQGVTLSIGLTEMRNHEANIENLSKEADIALYEAKRQGRNRLVTFDTIRERADRRPRTSTAEAA